MHITYSFFLLSPAPRYATPLIRPPLQSKRRPNTNNTHTRCASIRIPPPTNMLGDFRVGLAAGGSHASLAKRAEEERALAERASEWIGDGDGDGDLSW